MCDTPRSGPGPARSRHGRAEKDAARRAWRRPCLRYPQATGGGTGTALALRVGAPRNECRGAYTGVRTGRARPVRGARWVVRVGVRRGTTAAVMDRTYLRPPTILLRQTFRQDLRSGWSGRTGGTGARAVRCGPAGPHPPARRPRGRCRGGRVVGRSRGAGTHRRRADHPWRAARVASDFIRGGEGAARAGGGGPVSAAGSPGSRAPAATARTAAVRPGRGRAR
jgi:hypothetical protein